MDNDMIAFAKQLMEMAETNARLETSLNILKEAAAHEKLKPSTFGQRLAIATLIAVGRLKVLCSGSGYDLSLDMKAAGPSLDDCMDAYDRMKQGSTADGAIGA